MIYEDIPGGRELLAWFGQEPTFHDAEIISLSLNRSGVSELKLHGWINTGKIGPDRQIHKHRAGSHTHLSGPANYYRRCA